MAGYKYLIITSTGGGAHLMVAKARKQLLLDKGVKPEEIYVVDIMGEDKDVTTPGESWIPRIGIPRTEYQFFSGKSNVRRWNSAQKIGGLEAIKEQERYVSYIPTVEYIQNSTICKRLKEFIAANEDLEEIYDTQAFSTAAICKAVYDANAKRKDNKKIKNRKMISECMTDKTLHYIHPLQGVRPEHAKDLQVDIINEPLRMKNESLSDFYKRIKLDHIHFHLVENLLDPKNEYSPLRKGLRDKSYGQTHTVLLKLKPDSEVVDPCLREEELFDAELFQQETIYRSIKKEKDDHFSLIMLGSQSSATILQYIDQYINQTIQQPLTSTGRQILFVALGLNDGTNNTLYAIARKHIEKRMAELKSLGIEWPTNAHILPLSFQDDRALSSLYQNVDDLVIRTGGMSSIEALATQELNPTRKVYLHSEALSCTSEFPVESLDAVYEALLPGTVVWEGGNAQYLMKQIRASLTSPSIIRFGLDKPAYQFDKSLVGMALNGTLDKNHLEQIRNALNIGGNPNLKTFSGLPLLAAAKDQQVARLLVNYGAEVDEEAERLWGKQLKLLETVVNNDVKSLGFPKEIFEQLDSAIEREDITVIKGLLHRFPNLAFSERALSIPKDRSTVYSVFQSVRGVMPLHAALQSENLPSDILKLMIYQYRNHLNQKDEHGKTPLSYCQNESLRLMMVRLGANPYYLDAKLSKMEQQKLVRTYLQSQECINQLRSAIINAFKKHPNNLQNFTAEMHAYFNDEMKMARPVPDLTLKTIYDGLCQAANEAARMNLIKRFVDWVLSFFAKDHLDQHALTQIPQLTFYKFEPKADSENVLAAPSVSL